MSVEAVGCREGNSCAWAGWHVPARTDHASLGGSGRACVHLPVVTCRSRQATRVQTTMKSGQGLSTGGSDTKEHARINKLETPSPHLVGDDMVAAAGAARHGHTSSVAADGVSRGRQR
jgi:hypothetical protein